MIVPAVATNIAAYVTVTAMYSQLADKQDQGWVMGVSVSIACLGLATAALSGGWLLNINTVAPMIAAVIFTVLGVVIGFMLRVNLSSVDLV